MRYLFGFLCVCALGVMPMVGCGETEELRDPCEGVVCEDDGNQCTYDICDSEAGGCIYIWVEDTDRPTSCDDGDDNQCTTAECWRGSCESLHVSTNNGSVCTFDGLRGVCVDGVCGEDLCKGVVCCPEPGQCPGDDDPYDCSVPCCDLRTGTCSTRCSLPDGSSCGSFWAGSCSGGVCRALF